MFLSVFCRGFFYHISLQIRCEHIEFCQIFDVILNEAYNSCQIKFRCQDILLYFNIKSFLKTLKKVLFLLICFYIYPLKSLATCLFYIIFIYFFPQVLNSPKKGTKVTGNYVVTQIKSL